MLKLLLSILNLLVKAPNILMHTNSRINKCNVTGMSIYSGTQNSNISSTKLNLIRERNIILYYRNQHSKSKLVQAAYK